MIAPKKLEIGQNNTINFILNFRFQNAWVSFRYKITFIV